MNWVADMAMRALRAGVPALVVASVAAPIEGQAFLPDPVDDRTFTLQFEKPTLPDSDELAFYTSIFEAGMLFPLGSRTLQLGLPMAIAGADFVEGTSFYLGNLGANLLFGEAENLTGFLGITLPTASNVGGPDLAILVGAVPYLNEPEKWRDDAFAVRGAWIPSRSLESGARIGGRLGGAAVTVNEFENLLVYGRVAGWASFRVWEAEVRPELNISYAVNSDDGLGEQLTAYLDLAFELVELPRKIIVFGRYPLDGDARQVFRYSTGFRVHF